MAHFIELNLRCQGLAVELYLVNTEHIRYIARSHSLPDRARVCVAGDEGDNTGDWEGVADVSYEALKAMLRADGFRITDGAL